MFLFLFYFINKGIYTNVLKEKRINHTTKPNTVKSSITKMKDRTEMPATKYHPKLFEIDKNTTNTNKSFFSSNIKSQKTCAAIVGNL